MTRTSVIGPSARHRAGGPAFSLAVARRPQRAPWIALGGFSLLAALLALASAGCAFDKSFLANLSIAPANKTPARMVVTLTQTPLERDSNSVLNGTLCRIYFFAEGDPFPVQANGNVTIAAYDPKVSESTDRQPDGLYQIGADRLAKHLRKDIIGQCYVFWLPFETAKRIQLGIIATYQPVGEKGAAGKELTSELVSVDLQPIPAFLSGIDSSMMMTK